MTGLVRCLAGLLLLLLLLLLLVVVVDSEGGLDLELLDSDEATDNCDIDEKCCLHRLLLAPPTIAPC